MNKYYLAIILFASGFFNLAEARIRGNIPATYIENRELVFRHTNMNSPQNPLQVQVVVDDANGTELAIDLAVEIGLGGNKATVTIPTVANDTRISLDVWGGKFSKENRFKHTMIIFNDPKLTLTDVLDNGTGLVSIPDSFSDPGLRAGVPGPKGNTGATGPQGAPGPVGATPTSIPGTSITSPVNESKMLDNSNQTLNLGGVTGAAVTITSAKSGAVNVTLPNNGGIVTQLNFLNKSMIFEQSEYRIYC